MCQKGANYSFFARMADRFPVTAWKPVLMDWTEHLEWQVMHWRKKIRSALFRMVSGERQVWQNTYLKKRRQIFKRAWRTSKGGVIPHLLLRSGRVRRMRASEGGERWEREGGVGRGEGEEGI